MTYSRTLTDCDDRSSTTALGGDCDVQQLSPSRAAESRESHAVTNTQPDENHTFQHTVQNCLQVAEELKTEGNDHFRAKRFDEALAAYRSGLGRLPKRKKAKREEASRKNESGQEDIDNAHENAETSESSLRNHDVEEEPEPTLLEAECAKTRSILNANIAACYVKLGDHKEAVAACSEALRDDPGYVKALQRRAASNEQINSWSSLTSAQEDYNKLLTILSPSTSEHAATRRLLQSLTPRLEAAQKRETDEMFTKLKGLGNSILGNFGLSTDNFQFVPNGQGGYSMNFTR